MKNKIILTSTNEEMYTPFEYGIGEIITMNSGQYPIKCARKIKVGNSIHHYFIKGKFVPQFDDSTI